jgi:hypothetical protein
MLAKALGVVGKAVQATATWATQNAWPAGDADTRRAANMEAGTGYHAEMKGGDIKIERA